MSCTDIAKYFLHFLICQGTVFAVPWYFCFGTFCPKVKTRSVSTGPQLTGFGEAPQQAFWQAFCCRTAQKFRVCSHSNCLPKTQVWLHLPCLPLVKRPQKAFLPQCENKYHSTPLTDHSCSYILYLKLATGRANDGVP